MFVDSHCHLNFPQLQPQLPTILDAMQTNQVEHALVVAVNLPDWQELLQLVERYPQLSASVGVHPGYRDTPEPTVAQLVTLAESSNKVVAIGETGLDYFRSKEPLEWQRDRFRTHIRASHESGLPLIIHTRAAREDTIDIMRQEQAERTTGVMHCFTESWEMAQAALDMGFYISLSGIVTFNNAQDLQQLAKKIPLERLLIETDSPYLAPVPYRGKTNDPSKVIHVAEKIAELRNLSIEEVALQTKRNFYKLFNQVQN